MTAAALSVDESIRVCRRITRRSATSFYYAFKTLPRARRTAFEVVYAFMRISDDLSDDAPASGDAAARIRAWRALFHGALDGDVEAHPVLPALMAVMEEFAIPARPFDDLIDGTERDLGVVRFRTWEELEGYCYDVASTVGLVSLRILGLKAPGEEAWMRAEDHAIACGKAFQLTNILRDVREDAERGRVYLPLDDLARFGVDEDALLRGEVDHRLRALVAFEAERAQELYAASAPLLGMVARPSRPCLATMRGIYAGILDRIERADHDVWTRRARVPLGRKLEIAARAWLGLPCE